LDSQILITSDFDRVKERFSASEYVRLFEKEEFGIEDAKAVIKEAYVSASQPKKLILLANRYNVYAQNALLKILEEPPPNVSFVLCARSKSAFLPTILSRLPVHKEQKEELEEWRFERFDLARLYDLIQDSKNLSKAQAKGILKGLLHYTIDKDLGLDPRELDYFAKASELIELNSNIANIFITAGLIILRHQKRRR